MFFRQRAFFSSLQRGGTTRKKVSGGKGLQATRGEEHVATRTPPRHDPADIERFFLQRRALTRPEMLTAPLSTSPHDATTTRAAAPHGAPLSSREDVCFHRCLSNRFTSLCDQDKSFGTAEVALHVLQNDVRTRLRWAREARRLLYDAVRQQRPQFAGKVPRRLVVLLLYSHTRHDAAVGHHMRCIRNHVKAMLAERDEEILGVLTVAVGVKWRDFELADGNRHEDGPAPPDDVLWYPNAGLYTFNALLQCLCHVGQQVGGEDADCSSVQLHRKILILSEGWFHVRTAAELHQPLKSSPDGSADTIDVEPMPFVLGGTHTAEELLQFARYTACRAVAL